MKIYSILAALLLLQGCASLNRETMVEESIYQLASAVDMTQTIAGPGEHPKQFYEFGEFHINGYHPKPAAIVEYQLSMSLIHLGVTYLLARDNPGPVRQWLTRAWEAGTIGLEVSAITNNYRAAGDQLFYTHDRSDLP